MVPGTAVLEFGLLSTFVSQPDLSIGITVSGIITIGLAPGLSIASTCVIEIFLVIIICIISCTTMMTSIVE